MERSYGYMNNEFGEKNYPAMKASAEYIRLEIEYRELGELTKKTYDKAKLKRYRKQRKNIRTKQNMLYPMISRSGYTPYVVKRLGMKTNQALYFRYRNEFGSFKDREK